MIHTLIITLLLSIQLYSNENININPLTNFVSANNQFTFKLLKETNKENENSFFSPISISSIFGALQTGSADITYLELNSVFNFSTDARIHQQGIKSILTQLSTYKDELALNNTIWVDKHFEIEPRFIVTSKAFFKTSIEKTEFSLNPIKETNRINSTISDNTNNAISNLIPEGSITKKTTTVLTNTIYFKDTWKNSFNAKLTQIKDFYVTPNYTVPVKMMRSKNQTLNYFENNELQAIELPYKNNKISMIILLPTTPIESFIQELSNEYLMNIKKKFRKNTLSIHIPKIQISSLVLLHETLPNMGASSPFEETANFSKMSKKNDIKITEAYHKAFLDINEQGTEAAAATAAVSGFKTTAVTSSFKANRPFIIIIQEKATNTILFMGKFANPSLLNQ